MFSLDSFEKKLAGCPFTQDSFSNLIKVINKDTRTTSWWNKISSCFVYSILPLFCIFNYISRGCCISESPFIKPSYKIYQIASSWCHTQQIILVFFWLVKLMYPRSDIKSELADLVKLFLLYRLLCAWKYTLLLTFLENSKRANLG